MLEPTLRAVLVRASDRREYEIATSTTLDAWPFTIDRGGASLPTMGLVSAPSACSSSRRSSSPRSRN